MVMQCTTMTSSKASPEGQREERHLAEGRPVIFHSLGQTVSMFTVRLEEASCAQFVEWP